MAHREWNSFEGELEGDGLPTRAVSLKMISCQLPLVDRSFGEWMKVVDRDQKHFARKSFQSHQTFLPAPLQKLVGELFLTFAGKFCGRFGGNLAGFFSDPQKAEQKKSRGKLRSIFSWEIS